ncbi:MAG TPA: glycogen synthase GlgA [Bryobacteraceae bacterium]|nr:glycogen synthase GlgA [Bryobacteraceae bacterium]
MKILMVASEAAPFAKTGGLADVLGALPAALAERGEQVAVVIPAYRQNQYPGATREAYRNLFIPIGSGYRVNIRESTEEATHGVTHYFVECPALYDRDGLYGGPDGDFTDNHLRFAVLSMAALGVVRYLFRAEVLHLHDWQAALAAVYLREHFQGDPTFLGVKTLFTIHNLGYQGIFAPAVVPQIALDPRWMNPEQLEFFGDVNFLKAGIAWSDAVSTVSKGYAREIQTPEYGFGLDGFLRNHGPITGIVNGVDYSQWSPEHDPHIARNYSAADLSGKRACKRAILAEYGLASDSLDRPLLAIISRFASQKGFDIFADAASRLLAEDLSLVVLGSGDPAQESMFRALAQAYPDRVGVQIGYDTGLSHRIEAGADMFLMPSRYEPCGLNQIYSLRYGTVPVVRATGGLDDTIEEDTGFKFQDYSGDALLDAVRKALAAYQNRDRWTSRIGRCMAKNFSWNASAGEYVDLYRRLAAGRTTAG